ncbi:diacylglycerol kinase family protein [Ramlibacter sp.]|uniref:diacylglycerol/lipid kinase family protein n=1 Tax=Ramlibacter sp. TaxID=1917967 RepID=UPI00183EC58B|nr:diacylglycerol kinase family protein [Ramlibacter sp.]MBA2672266.1 diacylglycerol kinase family lipid kinase [Ramlibacter sp.]
MTSNKVTVLVNAKAGQGNAPNLQRQIEDGCRARGLDAQLVAFDDGGQIAPAVQDALRAGTRTVVAGGGDGTVSAVAAALAGTDATLGVLPLGTLNHFAKDLKIPLELEGALDVLQGGSTMAVDVGEVNGRVFINNSSLGLYPEMVLDRDQQRSRLGRGKWPALAAAALHVLRRYPVMPLEVDLGDRTLRRRSPFVFIGNNNYAMEGFEIGSRASLADGRLSLYLSQHSGRFGLFALALRALFRRLRQAGDFDMLSVRGLVISTTRKTVRVSADGEVFSMRTPLRYSIRPLALRVRVPAQRQSPPDARPSTAGA